MGYVDILVKVDDHSLLIHYTLPNYFKIKRYKIKITRLGQAAIFTDSTIVCGSAPTFSSQPSSA